MDIGKAFTYIAEDDNWVSKLGVGALLSMVPIVNFAAFGYQVQIARNVREGVERPLPTWDDFGSYLLDGLRFMAVIFILMLPMLLLYGLIIAVTIGLAFASESGTFDASDPASGVFLMIMSLSTICIMPYTLIIWVAYPMFFIQLARRGSVKACFDLREMWSLVKAQPANYLVVLAVMFGLSMVISMLLTPVFLAAVFIPCIGFIITMIASGAMTILVGAVSGHLVGQFILEGEGPKPAMDDKFE